MAKKDSNIIDTTYIVMDMANCRWGRGHTLNEAARQAGVITKGGRKARRVRPDAIAASRIDQTDEHRLTTKAIDHAARSGIVLEGYDDGDIMLPFVGDYGDLIYRGTKTDIELDAQLSQLK